MSCDRGQQHCAYYQKGKRGESYLEPTKARQATAAESYMGDQLYYDYCQEWIMDSFMHLRFAVVYLNYIWE